MDIVYKKRGLFSSHIHMDKISYILKKTKIKYTVKLIYQALTF